MDLISNLILSSDAQVNPSNFTTFGDMAVWTGLIQILVLVCALLIGNTIRRKVVFIRKSLMPTALIGGFILLLLKLIPAVNSLIDKNAMEVITYHCLAIGVIALVLKKGKKDEKKKVGVIVETGLVTGATYMIQAVFGLVITAILFTAGAIANAGGGVLLALGFGQGTGQALTYGKIFQEDYGFTGGATFGLSIATIGFFVSAVVGVIYMNILRKKGKLKYTEGRKGISEKLEDYVHKNDIPNNESIDKLTMNLCLVLFVYGIVYIVMSLININLIWGFNFLLGSLFGLIVKLVLDFFQKKNIMHRNLTNDYLLDRISGVMFDVMIIAGVAAIDLTEFSNMWWQLAIVCVVGTIITFIYLRLACNELYKGYEQEGFFSMFGMLTGTASNGIILLREIDPAFETPASTNLVLSSLPAIAFGGGLLLVLGYCPQGLTQTLITIGILSVAFIVFTLIIFRRKIFKKYKKTASVPTAE